jgi:uncharacterized protein YjbJ (UPF0337 family)
VSYVDRSLLPGNRDEGDRLRREPAAHRDAEFGPTPSSVQLASNSALAFHLQNSAESARPAIGLQTCQHPHGVLICRPAIKPYARRLGSLLRVQHRGTIRAKHRLSQMAKETAMDWNRVEGNWKQMKGKIKEKWGNLTDDDLTAINGKRDQLEGKIQERYGIAKDQVRKDVDDWYDAQTW